MGLYEVPFFCVFVGFWDRDYLSQLPCVRYYVFVKSSFNILMKNASPRGHMCFTCLIFRLSGPCELLFLLCFIASILDLRSGECNVVCFVLPYQWICLFCVLRVCELFGETIRNVFGCSCYFVVECYGCV